MRAVIDTISSTGNEALLILAINHGLVTPCFSADILREYFDVLLRPKFGFVADEVESLLDLFRRRGLLWKRFQCLDILQTLEMTNSSRARSLEKLHSRYRQQASLSAEPTS